MLKENKSTNILLMKSFGEGQQSAFAGLSADSEHKIP